MLFNSWPFFLFLPVLLVVYFFLNTRKQNVLLVLASYFFYAVWDYRFCLLLFGAAFVSFLCGRKIYNTDNISVKKRYIWICVCYNLGVLAVFKYLGFGIDNFILLLKLFNIHTDPVTLNIILPVGISFYSFHAISYVVDIYKKDYVPNQDLIDVLLFISFFPLLVAGPIERAKHLLPQIATTREITYEKFKSGLFLIIWGLWKKVVIADNLSKIVNSNFETIGQLHSIEAYVTLVAFSFQIYCDFSGYTDIARGISRLLGFELLNNFNLPYFSVNPSDFWKRWHISLSSWLRDYLYISLGGNRKGDLKTNRNLIITMLLGGIWHGAAWNFVVWGLYHGLLLVGHKISSGFVKIKIPKFIAIIIMYNFTLIGWLFFRCNAKQIVGGFTKDLSFIQIQQYFKALFTFSFPIAEYWSQFSIILWCIIPLIIYEIFQYKKNDQYFILKTPSLIQTFILATIAFTLVRFGVQGGESFIYFQF